jgi:hypothetical protein
MFKIVYFIGCIVLFLGLLWSFLPHVYHEQVNEALDTGFSVSHAIHIAQGVAGILLGLILIYYANTRLKPKPLKKR